MWNDVRTAFVLAEEAVLRAVSADAELVVFSEQYATGWRVNGCISEKVTGTEVKEQWLSLAREHGVAVVGSYMRELPHGLPQNAMLVAGPDGEVITEYAKIHLFAPGGEKKRYTPGDMPVSFSYKGVTFGCAICFDLLFPELFRDYLRSGCECMLVQAAWPAARVADWELLLRVRALENRGYVVAAGCLGYDSISETEYSGRGVVCDPEGRIVADAGGFVGGCCAEVDGEAVRELRERWGIWPE
jgi:predicted amidohydrolase